VARDNDGMNPIGHHMISVPPRCDLRDASEHPGMKASSRHDNDRCCPSRWCTSVQVVYCTSVQVVYIRPGGIRPYIRPGAVLYWYIHPGAVQYRHDKIPKHVIVLNHFRNVEGAVQSGGPCRSNPK
jgi:hypothetical protein